ncbi:MULTISPECIES: helix-turn-helix domain-containing protein [Bacillus]|uniref:helix-turn-helix domain-containing protein n=1 Tax=Bacillus TaxID=1386 RepID=UPI001581F01B|nr:helix-turn-helix domain-containing protein [Bacillus glycinifermentans]MBU8785847.1 helix-turn-helix domain-containing protein [Bacillus glycinifermentans]NUJ15617.1 helix-turn-helix domain-containing protein [Bacillus glycinifermentans]
MDKDYIIELISLKLRLIRTESGYTQEKMANVLGISKKTLVQIEKGRTTAGWTHVVAVCALFRNSEVLQSVLGDEPLEVVETVAHRSIDRPKGKTLGGRVWWREIDCKGDFRMQQNLISHHYRILDSYDDLWYSTFEKEEAMARLDELASENGGIQ